MNNIEECSICIDNMVDKNNLTILECNHVFHTKCICNWCSYNKNIIRTFNNKNVINGQCPMCLTPFIVVINDSHQNNDVIINKECCCVIL